MRMTASCPMILSGSRKSWNKNSNNSTVYFSYISFNSCSFQLSSLPHSRSRNVTKIALLPRRAAISLRRRRETRKRNWNFWMSFVLTAMSMSLHLVDVKWNMIMDSKLSPISRTIFCVSSCLALCDVPHPGIFPDFFFAQHTNFFLAFFWCWLWNWGGCM